MPRITGAILDGTFLIIAAYISCEAWLAGLFFMISIGSQGMFVASSVIIAMDLSPNFAGSITALTNCVASMAGFVVPVVVGYLTPNVSQIELITLFKFPSFYMSSFYSHPVLNGAPYFG